MVFLNEKTLHDLEFDRVKQLLGGFCSSPLGKEAIAGLAPITDQVRLESERAEVSEAISFLDERGRFLLTGIADLSYLLEQAKKHALLDGGQFLLILETIDTTHRIRTVLTGLENHPILHRLGKRLSDHSDFGKRIRHTIDEQGAVRADASPTLKKLTHQQRAVSQRVERKLRALIARSPELISEPVITRRQGRLVVPIKSGALGAMGFVVHDRSATGQTLYAEPSALVPENNTLAELAGEIEEEKRRILRELTAGFREREPAFLRDRIVLAHLDFLFARATYAIQYHCSFPQFSPRISLRAARHPLLPAERVVPISLSLGGRTRMGVITGPNTGGKTVTLKTIGLLALMNQAGIPLPVSPDSELPIFSCVRSDIGDEQSISQNLSTFSAHMNNIISILQDASLDALILLDELGAGTDPQEGAALGLAIAERLLASEAFVVISTHLTPLKYFAIRHPAVKSAAMEFDVNTLSPTFRVVEGVPGKSNAFVIARGLGLPAELINRARAFLSQGEIRAEDIIEELQQERQALLAHRQAVEEERTKAAQLREHYEEKLASFELRKKQALDPRIKDLDSFLHRSQQEVEQLLSTLNRASTVEEARNTYHHLSALRRDLADRAAQLAQGDNTHLSPESLHVGDRVHVCSLRSDGRIIHLSPHGKAVVDLNGVRVITETSNLAPPRGTMSQPHSPRPISPRPARVPLQLNVRGMTVAEAVRRVESYVDNLLLTDIRYASILHGKGTGALRDAVRNYLSSCSFVVSCGPATPREGGEGVTVFELAGNED